MGQITDKSVIGGSVYGKVWTSRDIGGGGVPTGFNVTSYTVSPGTDEAFTFKITDALITCWDGARMQLVVENGTEPFSYESSDSTIAEIDSAIGIVTWHDTGAVTFTVTDSAGATAPVVFSPAKLFVIAGLGVSQSTASANCQALGGAQPLGTDVTNATARDMPAVRKTGTLWGEWGNAKAVGFPSTNNEIWTRTNSSIPENSVNWGNGSLNDFSSSALLDGICMITAG